ncbi:MAG: hypothetical protein ABW110_16110 [Steroidobacteraceae bacterium]
MTIEETISDGFSFAPGASDAVEYEFNTQELKAIVPRSRIVLVRENGAVCGGDAHDGAASGR